MHHIPTWDLVSLNISLCHLSFVWLVCCVYGLSHKSFRSVIIRE